MIASAAKRKAERGELDLAFYPHRSLYENDEQRRQSEKDGAAEDEANLGSPNTNMQHKVQACQLHMVPAEVFKKYRMKRDTGQGLRELWLTNQRLASLSHKIGSLLNLRTLGLAGNNLADLPETLFSLPRLERLILSNNRLASMPDALGNLATLMELRLDHNELESLPAGIKSLRRMQRLSVSANKISEIPSFLVGLRQLIEVDFSHNTLRWESVSALPWEEMSRQLQSISFQGNKEVFEAPPGLLCLEALEQVLLAGKSLSLPVGNQR